MRHCNFARFKTLQLIGISVKMLTMKTPYLEMTLNNTRCMWGCQHPTFIEHQRSMLYNVDKYVFKITHTALRNFHISGILNGRGGAQNMGCACATTTC